jgi:hypothetical protein
MCDVGRHSVGDGDEDGEDVVWVPIPASHITGELPRIDVTGEFPVILTGEMPRIVEPVIADADTSPVAALGPAGVFGTAVLPQAQPAATGRSDTPSVAAQPRAHTSPTHADLHLLRSIPGLRARALAAVVVPFLLYTVLLIILGRTDVYLIWLWVPTIVAGVLVGHFLDLAHKAREKAAATSAETSKTA